MYLGPPCSFLEKCRVSLIIAIVIEKQNYGDFIIKERIVRLIRFGLAVTGKWKTDN